ncbi:MAG: ferredoxin-type protein NapF [Phyllobacterium sp.]
MDAPAPISRRNFLSGRMEREKLVVRPPGLANDDLVACTGCGDCAAACPTHVVLLADGKPVVDFASGECIFCNACADTCPENLFSDDSTVFPHVMRIAGGCLAFNGVSCQSCRDRCPENAIRFRPHIGGPFRPVLDENRCTGCGACVGVCPVQAIGPAMPQGGYAHV